MYHSVCKYIITFVMLSNYTIKMQFRGVLHPEIPDILFFFNIKIFLQFKFQICASTQLINKIKKIYKKFSGGGGVRNSTERPKTRRLRCKGYGKN